MARPSYAPAAAASSMPRQMPRRTSYPAALLAKYLLMISVRQAAMIDDRLEKQYALGICGPI
jgi:hypothetical protein